MNRNFSKSWKEEGILVWIAEDLANQENIGAFQKTIIYNHDLWGPHKNRKYIVDVFDRISIQVDEGVKILIRAITICRSNTIILKEVFPNGRVLGPSGKKRSLQLKNSIAEYKSSYIRNRYVWGSPLSETILLSSRELGKPFDRKYGHPPGHGVGEYCEYFAAFMLNIAEPDYNWIAWENIKEIFQSTGNKISSKDTVGFVPRSLYTIRDLFSRNIIKQGYYCVVGGEEGEGLGHSTFFLNWCDPHGRTNPQIVENFLFSQHDPAKQALFFWTLARVY